MHAFLIAAHDHFIPHKRNNHHPHLLRHRHLFGLSALLVTLKIAAVVGTLAVPGAGVISSPITAANIAMLTNETRMEQQLPPLALEPRLTTAAQRKADDMVKYGYFDHLSPSGQTAIQLILAAGYPVERAAENLAVRFTQAEDVEQSWLTSRPHRDNILNPEYRDLGVGISNGTYKGSPATFVVQLFGRGSESTTSTVTGTSSGVSMRSLLTGTLQRTSQTVDLFVAFLVATVLLLALAIRLHERHLMTLVHALSTIGLALVLRMT